MLNNMLLTFSRPSSPPAPPHAPIKRELIPSPGGKLEILYALPENPSEKPSNPPLFFVHGGFGCAAVWTEYMTYLSNAPHNIPCYAISLRGHGASWHPSYLRMVYGTSRRQLADDIVTGVRWVQEAEEDKTAEVAESLNPMRVIMVAHANGGGLAQQVLNDGDVQVKGLALLESSPPSGILPIYRNWLKLDPFSSLRTLWHLGHPKSSLSSTGLVKQALFCKEKSDCLVRRFESLMPSYESLIWPLSMFFRFVSVAKILQNVLGFEKRPAVLIMAAGQSKLVGVPLMERTADEYRQGIEASAQTESDGGSQAASPMCKELKIPDVAGRVWYRVVEGAGHQLQNDLQWEDGAAQLAEFYRANCSRCCLTPLKGS